MSTLEKIKSIYSRGEVIKTNGDYFLICFTEMSYFKNGRASLGTRKTYRIEKLITDEYGLDAEFVSYAKNKKEGLAELKNIV